MGEHANVGGGAALQLDDTGMYGTFNDDGEFTQAGTLSSSNLTIKVVNGELVTD